MRAEAEEPYPKRDSRSSKLDGNNAALIRYVCHFVKTVILPEES